jgi:hypothetical protein
MPEGFGTEAPLGPTVVRPGQVCDRAGVAAAAPRITAATSHARLDHLFLTI